MASKGFSVAVVCSSNMNRSMEVHAFLKKKNFNIRSFGTGETVRLPGLTADKPNIYSFDWSYDRIYKDLQSKNHYYYTQIGVLNMLDRNRRIKKKPEKFQLCTEKFSVIISCEERVYDQILEHFEDILNYGQFRPVHVININIEDNHEDATIGAFLICELVTLLSKSKDLDNEIDQLIVKYEEKCSRRILYCILFY